MNPIQQATNEVLSAQCTLAQAEAELAKTQLSFAELKIADLKAEHRRYAAEANERFESLHNDLALQERGWKRSRKEIGRLNAALRSAKTAENDAVAKALDRYQACTRAERKMQQMEIDHYNRIVSFEVIIKNLSIKNNELVVQQQKATAEIKTLKTELTSVVEKNKAKMASIRELSTIDTTQNAPTINEDQNSDAMIYMLDAGNQYYHFTTEPHWWNKVKAKFIGDIKDLYVEIFGKPLIGAPAFYHHSAGPFKSVKMI